jgi:hypothetical protein
MKDPCDDCLVKTMCCQVCANKDNYEVMLKNALNQTKGTTCFGQYLNKFLLHQTTIVDIHSRKQTRSTYDKI